MILKQVTPSWAEAKKQLGEVNFLNQLRDFDKDHISDRTLRKVHTYTSLDDFDPEKVGVVSTAAKSLAMVVAPKKAKLDEAMQSLKEKQASLAEAKGKLAQLQKLLEKLQKDYDDKLNEKEELRKRAEMLQLKLDRASDLIDGLAGERVRWGETIRNLDGVFDLLPGDCLLATAFVSYMGPFVSSYREELMLMWKTSVSEMELPCSLELKLGNFLATPTLIREWNILGLPSDAFSTENGIITNQATRWPLIIDPQAQAWKWIRNMEGPKGLKTVDFGVPDYMRIIEIAMQRGEPILLQNVSEVLDPSVIPILNKALVKKGNETYIKVGDKLVDYNEKFKFFITTKMSNPHFPPEILTKTTLVNFAIKEEGLQAQLLGIVVRKEKPKLEELKDNLVLNIAAGRRTLMELEDELLRLLNESEGSLLDNMELITTLKSSKETSVAVNEQLESSLITEVEIDHAREGYVPCAVRASILFFVLYDLSFIDPMYQFSLDSYIDIFENSIKKSKRSDNLSERITSLNDYHTYAVYRNTCRGLFERHKLLFSFYVGIKILDAQGKIRHSDYQFLLKGGVVLDKKEQPQNPCIDWLPPESWDNITEMDKLSGFHGVVKTFEQFPKEWGEWYFKDAPESCMLIGEWQDICSEFQRMLFIRSLRPDRLSFCITSFVTNNIGSHFTEPPVLDIKAVFEDSSYKTPLIFVLSPGVDPTSALIQLAENSGMSSRFQSLSLGQGQAPFATRMIEQGSTQGNWVFLANCHLSLSWMPGLDKIIENLQSSGNVHKDFR
ncbi:hypothetical protein AAG570_006295 [Ranatra chinensis]|uniref:Uncharacterized protein n=1 Tax=Ranatra chinensis TaxID=642074 RepID=A0ABD0YVQ9_9HEMI